MARITIDIPSDPVFSTTIAVRLSDINHASHLAHDSFITLLGEARARLLNHFGYTDTDIEGDALVVADLAVTYKSQSFYGDVLKIECSAAGLNKYGCDIFYRVTNLESEKLILEAKTGIVFFNYEHQKVTAIPEEFVKKMGLSG